MIISDSVNEIIFGAIFAALYLGTDYSNGTIRNKMIIGHNRVKIYLSDLITVVAGSFIIIAVSFATTLVPSLCLGGKLGMPSDEFVLKIAVSLCAVIALCAIFTVAGMLFSSKSTIVTFTLVLTFVLYISAALTAQLLAEPEYSPKYGITEDGVVTIDGYEPNPSFVSGSNRAVLTAVNDILPFGQLFQLGMIGAARDIELMPLYSLGVLAASTAVGTLAFRKKDLK